MSENSNGTRKVVIGTAMHNMFCPYPGLQARLSELAALVDRMAEEAAANYSGTGLDLAVLPENAVNGNWQGPAEEVSLPLEGPVLDVMGEVARRRHCYVVVPLYLVDDPEKGCYSNAAVLLDRNGEVAGIYRKVFPVVATGADTAEIGVIPGTEFPVFDCDFGRLGIQICYDMAFDEGWEALRRQGAEIIAWPSQWPGQIHPSSRALRGRCFVVSSTWRNNACLLDPTGHLLREIRQDGVFVEQIDLEYVILGWQPRLRNGAAFDDAYGARAGYRYSEMEDCGIFWSNDPETPIAEMVRALGLETRPDALEHCRRVSSRLRGGPPDAPEAT
jgi:predicted amidohydrolase